MKNHYVYRSYEPLGRSYIGCRTCSCPIEEDPYMGSFTDKTFSPTQKEILAICDTREESLRTEIFFHEVYEVDKNPMFANLARQTSTSFNSQGITGRVLTEKHRQNMSKAHLGKPVPIEKRKNISKGMTGKPKSAEHCENIRKSKLGMKWWVNAAGERKFKSECPGPEWKRGQKW